MSIFATENQPPHVEAGKCRFSVGNISMMKAVETQPLKRPISMLARTDQPVEHWYWGRVVHDIDGISFHKESIVVDYCHDDSTILGYLDKFKSGDGGLECSGALIAIPGTIAEEIIIKAEHGVPYEASIFWHPESGIVVEEVMEGAIADVNGYQFAGPGVIIRKCVLHAVSICPHGQDPNTNTKFNQSTKTVSLTYKEPAMTATETNPEKTKPPATTPPAETAELTKFYKESMEAMLKRIDELETKFKAETGDETEPADLPTALAKIKELKTKLSKPPADQPDEKEETKFAEKFEELEKRIEAKFSHAGSSSSQSVSGDGTESEEPKKNFASMFNYQAGKTKAE